LKKNLLILFIFSALLPTVLVTAFYYYTQDSYRTSTRVDQSPSLTNIGNASFAFDKSSAISETLSITPELANKPVKTNKWYQNALSANPWPQPIYNLPLSTTLASDGLSMGIPVIAASADTISGPAVNDITLKPDSLPSKARVISYDELSLSIEALNSNGNAAYSVKLIKGSPFIKIKLNDTATIDLSNFSTSKIIQINSNKSVIRLTAPGKEYAIYMPSSSSLQAASNKLNLKSSDNIVIAALPKNATTQLRTLYDEASNSSVSTTEVKYDVQGSKVTTNLIYNTANGSETLLVNLPNQRVNSSQKNVKTYGSFETIRGRADIILSNSINYTTNVPSNKLIMNLPKNSAFFNTSKLAAYIEKDFQKTSFDSGSYDGAKELFRLANLSLMAHQSDNPIAANIDQKLKLELIDWLTYTSGEENKYFYYDNKVRGLVATAPQYDSDRFNDHHFHYGYFIYAATILGKYDKTFVEQYGKGVAAIANDIASARMVRHLLMGANDL
jgi:endoglucanase Acf2